MTVNSSEQKKLLGSAQRFRITLGVVAKSVSLSLALAYQDVDWGYLANGG
jgi:hypothetical protein